MVPAGQFPDLSLRLVDVGKNRTWCRLPTITTVILGIGSSFISIQASVTYINVGAIRRVIETYF